MFHRRPSARLALVSCLGLVLGGPGCASIIEGSTQTVRVITNPRGGTVIYEGREVADGDPIVIHKQPDAPYVVVNNVPVQLKYGPTPWLIADAGWLLVFVIPGLVALGVDFFSGCWRHYDDPQVIYVPAKAEG